MEKSSSKPNVFFWVIGIFAIIWNLLGIMAYLNQFFITDEAKSQMSNVEITYMNSLPTWYMAVFAIAVFAGFLGSLMLVLKKRSAYLLFILSFIAVIFQQVYHFILSNATNFMKGFDFVMVGMVVIFSTFLLWYSKNLIFKGILK